MMKNIKIKIISRYADRLAKNLFFDKIKNKSELKIIASQFLVYRS